MLIIPPQEIETDPLDPYLLDTLDIEGYEFIFALWEERYAKELENNNIIPIDSSISINRQSIQPVANGIYTKELGSLPDTDKDIREFSCDCGYLHARFYDGMVCDKCNTICKSQYGADITRVGWIDIAPFYIICPNAYEVIAKVIGNKNIQKILLYDISIDIDGNLTPDSSVEYTKNGTIKQKIMYSNIGMMEFAANFERIISYYADLRKTSHEDAQYLINHKKEAFSSKIPVSSIYLRPTFTSTKKRSVSFDKINAKYVKIISNAKLLKRIMRKEIDLKRALNILYDIQLSLNELYLLNIRSKLSGKNKLIRGSILGNRMNFSSRMVIRSFVGPYSGMGKVEISYKAFLELHILEIINALMRGYGNPRFTTMTVYEVMEFIRRCQYKDDIDIDIWDIIQLFLKKRLYNPILINRPPTMDLGSIQCFDIVRITPNAKDKTLGIPLSSCSALNADFDGDNLSGFSPKEKMIIEACMKGLSPAKLIIDRTGSNNYFNPQYGLLKDELTTLASFLE
jgi:DNA-directed RNA polymerase beta' subunit